MEREAEPDRGLFNTKRGHPSEPGLCAECGVHPGTERIENVTGALGGEPPDADSDRWVCRSCLHAQVVQGWIDTVTRLDQMLVQYPGDQQNLKQAASRTAAHLRAEFQRMRLSAPDTIRSFIDRYGA